MDSVCVPRDTKHNDPQGRCIYGGIYDPENAAGLIDDQGFRTDVLQALRECKTPLVRWPGGNFVSSYRWEDGVGPKASRPARLELAWLGVESNQFGTDEVCELEYGAEIVLTLWTIRSSWPGATNSAASLSSASTW